MNRQFVVGVSDFLQEKQRELIERLRSDGYGWWHWIGDMWFIATASDKVTVKSIYEMFSEYTDNSNVIVMEIECKQTFLYGPIDKHASYSDWFLKNFSMQTIPDTQK